MQSAAGQEPAKTLRCVRAEGSRLRVRSALLSLRAAPVHARARRTISSWVPFIVMMPGIIATSSSSSPGSSAGPPAPATSPSPSIASTPSCSLTLLAISPAPSDNALLRRGASEEG